MTLVFIVHWLIEVLRQILQASILEICFEKEQYHNFSLKIKIDRKNFWEMDHCSYKISISNDNVKYVACYIFFGLGIELIFWQAQKMHEILTSKEPKTPQWNTKFI